MSEVLKVFVYGTLKPGEANYDRYCQPSVVEAKAAIVYGELYHLPFGYPALTPGNTPVHGFLLYFSNSNILVDLDELEGYYPDRPIESNEYFRTQTDVFELESNNLIASVQLGQAWVYQMRPALIDQLGGIWLPEGNWTGMTAVYNSPD